MEKTQHNITDRCDIITCMEFSWICLAFAIICEIIGTTTLKMSNGFTVLLPSVVTIVMYISSFFLLSKALKTIEVGITYAIWSGVGTAIITIIGIMFFNENVSFVKILCIVFIIIGSVGLKMIN